jgi:asparagine synthase (glutamine-hydrolysing)
MCGLAGILAPRLSSAELRKRTTAMRERLAHRGPDSCGEYFDESAGLGFAHTRLSILDLSPAGHQPMTTADGRYTIVFNGEIYNFLELRTELERQGVRFTSRSDTEVILRLYERHGVDCVSELNGMFALAIWDRVEQDLFLARGPMGIKPLYVWQVGDSIAFASEIRALLAADLGPRRLCQSALMGYLMYGTVQEPESLIENVRMLPAAHSVRVGRHPLPETCFWKLELVNQPMPESVAIERTRQALLDSVWRHFISDVPVGVFLSGGIDSTAIVALAREAGYRELKTFCISFDDQRWNEGDLAARTAKSFGTEHQDWRMTPEMGRELLHGYLESIDQPTCDGFNTYCISKLAHEAGLKVVLSGLGGDELFGGYASFRSIPQFLNLHKGARLLGPLRSPAGGLMESSLRDPRLKRLGAFLASDGSVLAAHQAKRGFFTQRNGWRIAQAYIGKSASALEFVTSQSGGHQPTVADEISEVEINRYMVNQLLRDSDVMSMAWGLELRVPFVDSWLADSVGKTPAQYRLAHGKKLLLDAVPEVPEWVANRPKRGFTFPFEEWIGEGWKQVFGELDERSPVPLVTWYRRWCLFTLEHFLRTNNVDCPRLTSAA